jgi:two-component system, NtrC family, response regulator GlrR
MMLPMQSNSDEALAAAAEPTPPDNPAQNVPSASECSHRTAPDHAQPTIETIRRFVVTILEGVEAGRRHESTSDRCSIGSHELNDIVLDESTVSRFHCEIRIAPEGALVIDLKSRNGTVIDGVRIREAFLRGGSILRLGRVTLRFDFATQRNTIPLSQRRRFGGLVGNSVAMRSLYALLDRAAQSDVTVLLEGETGTGKGKAAEGIHAESPRAKKPFIVIDCSAIQANLLESELFGHELGAFTGAKARRIGAFEEAHGGTVFLDEIGELPPDLQPKLLRVIENRELRRVGANRFIPVDVRVIAATNCDLRAEVNAGRFRSDLYFRLAVLKISLPPLRTHIEDIPSLVEEFLEYLEADEQARTRCIAPEFLSSLQRNRWPGNARELRNYIERCVVMQESSPWDDVDDLPLDNTLGIAPFTDAKRQTQNDFEKNYLNQLMQLFDGKVAQAAKAAGVDRVYLYRLLRKHGMKAKG